MLTAEQWGAVMDAVDRVCNRKAALEEIGWAYSEIEGEEVPAVVVGRTESTEGVHVFFHPVRGWDLEPGTADA